MRGWEPVSPFEEDLRDAFAAGDLARCLGLLRAADFALPISEAAAAGRERPAWATVADGGRTWVAAFTSVEAMRAVAGAGTYRVSSLVELAAGWPDPRWGLVVNPGLPVRLALESGTVARLAVPSMAQDLVIEPGSGLPVVQKLLRPRDLHALLGDGEARVSGYCHHALDVAHIATPGVLAAALGQPEAVAAGGSVNILRWRAAGPALYRTPYGGLDEEGMAAVAGWVIEEPPFVGLGLVPNVDQVIREYKVDGVVLTHGAEIVELTTGGAERRRAVYDGDTGRWLLVRAARPGMPT
ncbi:SseB family protein [Nonomuraea lactucae]|uniref:SseB family protein n=1 Tax=Nonomuraea lactucae TaxID=2249762 RepID=UPI000DE39981|nr:SseB family protein [Nonomuraea lactucae]